MDFSESRELAQATRIAADAHELALAIKIDSPETLNIASTELRSIAERRKQMEELRLSLTRPLDESKRRIMDLFRVPTDRLLEAEGLLRKEVGDYQRQERERIERERQAAEARARAESERLERERRAAEAEERRIRAEQERIERERQEQIERERAAGNEAAAREAEAQAQREAEAAAQAAAEARARAEQAQAAIEEADVAPVTALQIAPKAEGISTRQTWKAEVTSLDELIVAAAKDVQLRAFLCADTKALGQAAKALKGQARIPGVRVYAEEGIAVRRAS